MTDKISLKKEAMEILDQQISMIADLEEIDKDEVKAAFKTSINDGTTKIAWLIDGITSGFPKLESVAESAIRKYFNL